MDNRDLYYVVGGQQKRSETRPSDEFTRFARGIIATYPLHNAPSSSDGELKIEYVTPAQFAPDGEERSILFKSGSIVDDKFYVCTQTEILIFQLPDFRQTHHISLPCFNDVHHVVPTNDGTLLVAVTGLDLVVELSLDGEIVREWDVLGRETWSKFSRDVDYRKVLTTKPHDSHPNFVFQVNEDVWVTRFRQRDAVCLTNPSRRIEIGIEKPHDGHVYGDRIFFTTVDGHVVIANAKTDAVETVLDLHSCNPDSVATGWSRGLKIIDDEHILVGFSTLRVTKIRENVRWVKQRFGLLDSARVEPTHVSMYNIKHRKLCWRKNLDGPNLDVIFSIL